MRSHMTTDVLKMANLMQDIMDGYQGRLKRRYNRLRGFDILLHGKACLRGIIGHFMFDLKLYLVDYFIVIMGCIGVVIMQERVVVAS